METKNSHRWHSMYCYTGMYDDQELNKSYMTVLCDWECEDCKRKITRPEGIGQPPSEGTCRFIPKDFGNKVEQLKEEIVRRHGKKKRRRR